MITTSRSYFQLLAVLLFAFTSFALVKIHPLSPSVKPAVDTSELSSSAEGFVPLRVIIPEPDTVIFYNNRHRIAARTLPGSKAFINEEEVTVYPTGAFVGMVPVPHGESTASIRVVLPDGEEHTHHMVFQRQQAPKSTTVTPRVDRTGFPVMGRIRVNRTPVLLDTNTDRLGGRTHSFLADGVSVYITGQTARFFEIQLNESNTVYVPRHMVDTTRENPAHPVSRIGGLESYSDSSNHYFVFSLDKKLPYLSRMHSSGSSVVVDLFGATKVSSSELLMETGPLAPDIRIETVTDDHLRFHITPKNRDHWGHQLSYSPNKDLILKVRRPPVLTATRPALEGMYIALDAGHGGENLGAKGATGTLEKDLVLEITEQIERKLLQQGARVYMTRRHDHDLSLSERALRASNSGASILLSIHANSIAYHQNPLATHGVGVYYGNPLSKTLAEELHAHLSMLPLRDYGLRGNFNFALTEMQELPAVLIETAFLSHPEDEMKLLDPEFQNQLVEKIVSALIQHFSTHGAMEADSAYTSIR
ncbi:N-acetylmuramoyl-L-alanine amidase [Balneolaceae bacterium ANBcel3]|nr:N-acetylmuramoyl-L-alanine amidase [Balneolaceae bacterium ANBcel3]